MMPHRRLTASTLLVLLVLGLTSCASMFTAGREFPSPKPDAIKNGTTTKADLVRLFGEPTQAGVKDGDPTLTWYYFRKGQKSGEADLSKTLDVTLNAAGVVKSYSFSSNFPEDMKLR